jgi:phage repressor protein C with HTH and peptisase S24 domain
MDTDTILEGLKRLGVPHERIAAAIHRDRTAATKMMNTGRAIKASEIGPLTALIAEYEEAAGEVFEDRLPARDYLPVEILPSFAGMGAGGSGEGDRGTGLVPRYLVENELRAKPADLLLIDVRGDSMEPDFRHGDQLLIDRRDRNPTQPGAFAIIGEGAYVVKNIERTGGQLRIFSSNQKYRDEQLDPEQVEILGRPVWFARRL